VNGAIARGAGALDGLRVIELAGEWSPLAGKILADLGAEVIVVEPSGGHHTRSWGPFLDDLPGPDRSLWWWAMHTSKKAVQLDLTELAGRDRLLLLLQEADVLLESELPGALDRLGLDEQVVTAARPDLIWTTVTSFGLLDERSALPATDLTLLAGAGPVWMCGYDDHSLPPVRGEGGQAVNVAGVHAAIATMSALLGRSRDGRGQRIDVSVNAALNVATEGATYEWIAMHETLQRQTCRHASARPTMPVQVQAADGRFVSTGFPPRHLREVSALLGWLKDLGLGESAEAVLLGIAEEQGGIDFTAVKADPLQAEMMAAGREALRRIAASLPAAEFFVGGQERGLAVAIINSPRSMLEDRHVLERRAWTEIEHVELGEIYRYPPPPFRSTVSPYRIRSRAPLLGEHDAGLPELPDGG
jgi:crotonobetainyl-CoA:carnitine CoA-transferase CaiB-like acyl-CoA transferase